MGHGRWDLRHCEVTLHQVHVLLVDRAYNSADLALRFVTCLPEQVVHDRKRRRKIGLHIVAVLDSSTPAELNVSLSYK